MMDKQEMRMKQITHSLDQEKKASIGKGRLTDQQLFGLKICFLIRQRRMKRQKVLKICQRKI